LSCGPGGPECGKRPHAHCGVGAPLVLGHDDKCPKGPFCLLHKDTWLPVAELEGVVRYNGDDIPLQYRIPESCPIRHRVGIVRLLLAVNGANVLINSAQRMWTMVWLANHFELTQYVRDSVMTWFMAYPNTKFVEICPEESFKVACALQIGDIARASFQILVNELAIDYAATNTTSRKQRYTFSQRKRDIDFESDAVDYAVRDFVERIKATYNSLAGKGKNPFDVLGPPFDEWRKLQLLGESIETAASLRDPSSSISDLHEAYKNLKAALEEVLLNMIARIPEENMPTHLRDLIEAQRDQYVPQRAQRGGDEDRQMIERRYELLSQEQRILTAPFWYEFQQHFDSPNFEPFRVWESRMTGGQSLKTLRTVKESFNACMRLAMIDYPITFDRTQLPRLRNSSNLFNLEEFYDQLKRALRRFGFSIVGRDDEDTIANFILSEHLILNLNEREMNYLPVWAGGMDDGTFGAFMREDIPETVMGPSQPGPSYHTGHTLVDGDGASASGTLNSMSASDLAMSQLGLDDATVAGSVDAQNSISTTMLPRNRVVVAPSEVSELFMSESEAYADARYFEPMEQVSGAISYEHGGGDDDDDVDMFDDASSVDTLSTFEQL
jgi:hypothetical protein